VGGVYYVNQAIIYKQRVASVLNLFSLVIIQFPLFNGQQRHFVNNWVFFQQILDI